MDDDSLLEAPPKPHVGYQRDAIILRLWRFFGALSNYSLYSLDSLRRAGIQLARHDRDLARSDSGVRPWFVPRSFLEWRPKTKVEHLAGWLIELKGVPWTPGDDRTGTYEKPHENGHRPHHKQIHMY